MLRILQNSLLMIGCLGVVGCERTTPATQPAATQPSGPPTVAELRQTAWRVWNEHQTMTADIEIEVVTPSATGRLVTRETGTVEAMNTGQHPLVRVELDSRKVWQTTGEPVERELRMLTVFDGQYTWDLTQSEEASMAIKAGPTARPAVTGNQVLGTLDGFFELEVQPDEVVDGRRVWVVYGTPGPSGPGHVKRAAVYIDQQHGVLVKSVLEGQQPNSGKTSTFRNFKFDIELDPQRFQFEVPPGVELFDQTGEAGGASGPTGG